MPVSLPECQTRPSSSPIAPCSVHRPVKSAVESSADVADAEVPARPRVAIAEEIQESSERVLASPEPATRTFKER
jgi:hypothetical protein